jgi:hypothetical protein
MFKFVELFHNKETNVYISNVEESTNVQTPVLQNTVIFVKKKQQNNNSNNLHLKI